MDLYTGVITKIRYHKPDTSFYIVSLLLDNGDIISAKGDILGITISVNSWISLTGEMVFDKRWGKQINIIMAPQPFESLNKKSFIGFLTNNGCILEAIKSRDSLYGEFSFSELDKYGFDENQILKITNSYNTVKSNFELSLKLTRIGLNPNTISKVVSVFGLSSYDEIIKNPWIISKIPSVTIEEMDIISRRVGKFPVEYRLYGLLNICMRKWCNVHTCISSSEFLNRFTLLTNSSIDDISRSVKIAKELGDIITNKVDGEMFLYIPNRYHEEVYCSTEISSRKSESDFISNKLKYLSDTQEVTEREYIDLLIESTSSNLGISLDNEQKLGIGNIFFSNTAIITGLPGTGKSTSIKVLTDVFREMKISFLLLSPTGVAAKRLRKITGYPAYTIHRALRANQSSEWGYGQNNTLNYDVIVVDESSMIDQFVLDKLMKASSRNTGTRILFIGDPAQLPSVGYGNVLRDLINSGVIPKVFLSKIYRQEEKSQIIFSSHDVYNGNFPRNGGEFSILEYDNDDDIYSSILDIVHEVNGKDQWQVLSPRYAGVVGVDNLNNGIRDEINKNYDNTVNIKDSEFRVSDKVMVIRNNYDMGVTNGDIGYIKDIDHQGKKIIISMDSDSNSEELVIFPFMEVLSHIRLAYACTVHKFQGMETDVIIMPVVNSFGIQLQRNLLYTAITRARKRVYLIGSKSAIGRAVSNYKEDSRVTNLSKRIKNGN